MLCSQLPRGRPPSVEVQQVLTLAERGVPLREAWERAGKPTSWRNILKQHTSRCKPVQDEVHKVAATTPVAPSDSRPSLRKRKAFRLSSSQLEKKQAVEVESWTQYKETHKQATL